VPSRFSGQYRDAFVANIVSRVWLFAARQIAGEPFGRLAARGISDVKGLELIERRQPHTQWFPADRSEKEILMHEFGLIRADVGGHPSSSIHAEFIWTSFPLHVAG
jgi:hypothetical protein